MNQAKEEKQLQESDLTPTEKPGDQDLNLAVNVGSLVDRAEKAAERLEAANKQFDSLLKEQAKVRVEKTLGGSASAGRPGRSLEDVETEEAKALLEGTGLEEYAFPKTK